MPLLTPLIVFFPSKTNYTKVSKVLCLTSAVSTKIVTSLIAVKTKTHKWPCNPIPHCVLSAMHCHRQQSQTPAGTELNSCLALFIASWPRKLKGCLGEGVSVLPFCWQGSNKAPNAAFFSSLVSAIQWGQLSTVAFSSIPAQTCVA